MTTQYKERIAKFQQYLRSITNEQREKILSEFQAISVTGSPYSPTNTCLLAHQEAQKGIFGGFNQWKQSGRIVKKGEKAFYIFIPSKKKEEENVEGEKKEEKQQDIVRFFTAAVFHETQTEPLTATL